MLSDIDDIIYSPINPIAHKGYGIYCISRQQWSMANIGGCNVLHKNGPFTYEAAEQIFAVLVDKSDYQIIEIDNSYERYMKIVD